MNTRVRVPVLLLIWVIIGIIVAMNKGYGDIDNASELATFILAVILWPIPATGGRVGIRF
jgi:hypothetical protein